MGIVIFILLLLLPQTVMAHAPVEIYFVAFAVFLLPALIGILIVGKGKRQKWTIISLIVVAFAYFLVVKEIMQYSFVIVLFLIPAALLVRYKKIAI